jgi:hypothetical protein
LFPDGDRARRRHARMVCVLRARRAGRLPTREEWSRAQRRDDTDTTAGTPWTRVRACLRRRPR